MSVMIEVRHVPDEVHRKFKARAEALNTRLVTGGRRLASAAARWVDVETV